MAENQELIKAITMKLKKYYEEYKKEYYIQYNQKSEITIKEYVEKIDNNRYLNSIKKKVIGAIENYKDINQYYEKYYLYNKEQFQGYLYENKYNEKQKGKTY
jgi:hypothetical protein